MVDIDDGQGSVKRARVEVVIAIVTAQGTGEKQRSAEGEQFISGDVKDITVEAA